MALSLVGVLTAFGAGLLSFLSPCVLPLVPGYLSYLAGTSIQEGQVARDQRQDARGKKGEHPCSKGRQ